MVAVILATSISARLDSETMWPFACSYKQFVCLYEQAICLYEQAICLYEQAHSGPNVRGKLSLRAVPWGRSLYEAPLSIQFKKGPNCHETCFCLEAQGSLSVLEHRPKYPTTT